MSRNRHQAIGQARYQDLLAASLRPPARSSRFRPPRSLSAGARSAISPSPPPRIRGREAPPVHYRRIDIHFPVETGPRRTGPHHLDSDLPADFLAQVTCKGFEGRLGSRIDREIGTRNRRNHGADKADRPTALFEQGQESVRQADGCDKIGRHELRNIRWGLQFHRPVVAGTRIVHEGVEARRTRVAASSRLRFAWQYR